jgi:DNA-directed RNA polymerase subunit beta
MKKKLSFTSRKRMRRNFGRILHVQTIPGLIQIQLNSYKAFLQADIPSNERKNIGLQEVISGIFPVEDPNKKATVEFVKYEFSEPGIRGGNYAAALKVTLRLIVWEVDEETGSREVNGIKEQEVYLGDIPFMTEKGSFVINGTERVIVSQMHRSPGVFFDHDKGKGHSSGKFLYSARVIPYRGSWLDIEFDAKDIINFRIDRKRKLYVSTLLRALGMSTQEMLTTYYDTWEYKFSKGKWITEFLPDTLKGTKIDFDLINADNKKLVVTAGTKITARIIKKLHEEEQLKNCLLNSEQLIGKFVAENIIDDETGEVIIAAGEELTSEIIVQIESLNFKQIKILAIDNIKTNSYIRDTINIDKNNTKDEALVDIFRVLRPGEPPTIEAAEALFHNLYFEQDRYDVSAVGRIKLNARLALNEKADCTILTKTDIVEILRKLCEVKDGFDDIDDIDHLGNRRVRSVGELLENQFRIGLVRVERAMIERMGSVDIDTVMPHDLINSKLLVSVIREFFSTSQLSQFMDQTNPLSEITHKRRLSALGPGGITRDRASFEVRDVHPTHYGRICPIETPEGQNIGLINSLSTFARVNEHGFIESPYRKVINRQVTDEVIYLSAIEEGAHIIAQADVEINDEGRFISDLVSCRSKGDFIMAPAESIEYVDVSPMQLVSVAASLIPFLENDDANRALMGSNMQRQAVPLLRAEAPFVGTGIEGIVAKDSGATILAKAPGVVEQVDGKRIVVRTSQEDHSGLGVEIYSLQKYQRSNHNTCINQTPLVKVGDFVQKDDIIADGPSTELGELALGRNLLVAFMPWNGYNYEDSILISEKLVMDDILTSIHIEEFEVVARDTRLGPEEITRDIPNVGDENLRHLDEVGIVHVGAEIKPGDILVGKVTPKSESPMTPEEKLLRAIFGEKAADVRDSSLHVPPGVSGTVVDVQVMTRRGVEKDQRALSIEREQITRFEKDKKDQLAIIENVLFSKLKTLLIGQTVNAGPKGMKIGSVITEELLEDFTHGQWKQIAVSDENISEDIKNLVEKLDSSKAELEHKFNSQVDRVQSGDDLPQGALKVVKVFIAMKHKLQPGDKMAGRHGNKGVISRILPVEDLPYLENGQVVDIVLNPLGVPSRMNVGQILETHLGWAAAKLGEQLQQMLDDYRKEKSSVPKMKEFVSSIYEDKDFDSLMEEYDDKEFLELAKNLSKGIPFATPVFDGAKEHDINRMLVKAGVKTSGQSRLYDGRTGEIFDRETTVGYIYMLKLHHLVDDKIHARSIGPYSLVTQQPLGGKSHFGGQRLGEMECWALEAYGAAYTLQEMLTVKSDDVTGRIKMYESIVRGDQSFDSGVPESFNVMLKELRSLCLNIELVDKKK